MLLITVDVFSGRPNPVAVVSDPDVVDRIVGAVSRDRGLMATPRRGWGGLGLREVIVSQLEDDPRGARVPRTFALASTAAPDFAGSVDLARFVIEQLPLTGDRPSRPEQALTPITPDLIDHLVEQLEVHLRERPPLQTTRKLPYNPRISTVTHPSTGCDYEISQFNPAFWNADPYVMQSNNCYNYARNHRTDTFAQPGHAHGLQLPKPMFADMVLFCAHKDGLVDLPACLIEEEYPRREVALVLYPWDYHWYRQQRGGFWGHKPGVNAATNLDNAGALVVDPQTADRGPYTEFVGYLTAGRSVVIS